LMAWQSPRLAALSGQPPEPGGSRRKARGVDGEGACRATMVLGPSRRKCKCVSALLLILFARCSSSDYVWSIDPRWSPFAMRRSPHQLISGWNRVPYQDPSCIIARAQGSKGDGTILYRGVFQPCRDPITHPPWKRYILFFLFAAIFYLLLRTAPSGMTPVSR